MSSMVIDTLRASTISKELNDAELEILSALFELKTYRAGEIMIEPGKESSDNLYVLASGDIEVKIDTPNEGLTSLHILRHGDLAGIISFVAGGPSSHSVMANAISETQALCLERKKFEKLLNTHPMIVYKVMKGVVRNLHGITRRMNAQSNELSNYITRSHGRY